MGSGYELPTIPRTDTDADRLHPILEERDRRKQQSRRRRLLRAVGRQIPRGAATKIEHVPAADPYRPARPERARRRVRATSVLLAALLVIPLALSGVALAVMVADRNTATATGSGTAGQAPAGFAELFVRAWLTAGEDTSDTLKPFYPGPVDLTGRRTGGVYATAATAQTVEDKGGGLWNVTVAVQVAEQVVIDHDNPDRLETRDTGLHYYTVGVLQRPDGSRTATALPAETAAPLAPTPADTVVTASSPPSKDDPKDQTVIRFLQALLTPPPKGSSGQAEVDRLIAPGSGIRAITPAPFTSVEVRQVGYVELDRNQGFQARATVTAITLGGNQMPLDYSMRLGWRDDRVEVTRVSSGPAIKVTQGG